MPTPPLQKIVGHTYEDDAIPWSPQVELLACGHKGKHLKRHFWKHEQRVLAGKKRRCMQCLAETLPAS